MFTMTTRISVRHTRVGRFFVALLMVFGFASCHHEPKAIQLHGEAQGSYYAITYYDTLQRNLQPVIDSLLSDFDLTASLWEEQSLIRKVNANTDSTVNSLFCDLLTKSLAIEAYTQGAFNCKIGAVVNAWGFGFKHREEVTPQMIDSLLQGTQQLDAAHITVADHNGKTCYTIDKHPNIQIDFNATAQGYSVDLIAQLFDSLGITDYLIDVGGEVIGKGGKPNGEAWIVGIERPAKNRYSTPEVQQAIELKDLSVVTSGNYRKYYEKDGIRYSHTIDPTTGYPVDHTLLSVSVVSREAWYADAMATAFMVMGMEKAIEFIQQHPDNPDIQAVFFIYDNHGTYETYATPAFEKLITQ